MVYIIFTNEQHEDAEEIRDFLTEEKNLAASSSNLNWYELKNDNRIDQIARNNTSGLYGFDRA